MALELLGRIASVNASLTFALLDASLTSAWQGTDPELAKEGEFTGHPAQIMTGIDEGVAVTSLDVGTGKGVAFDLEGQTGVLDVYRISGERLVLVEPPRAWFADPDNYGDRPDEIEELFSRVVGADLPEGAVELATIEVVSGKLAAVYMWHLNVGSLKAAAEKLSPGSAAQVGDDNGPTGLVAALPPGTYRILRAPVVSGDLEAVAAYIVPAA